MYNVQSSYCPAPSPRLKGLLFTTASSSLHESQQQLAAALYFTSVQVAYSRTYSSGLQAAGLTAGDIKADVVTISHVSSPFSCVGKMLATVVTVVT